MVLAKCLRFSGYDWWEYQWPLHLEHARWLRQQTLLAYLFPYPGYVYSVIYCHHLDIPKVSQTQPVQDRIDHDFV